MKKRSSAVAMVSEALSFKCTDGGHRGCVWGVTGDNEDLLIFQIEMHAQNSHNLVIDEVGKEKIRGSITHRAA